MKIKQLIFIPALIISSSVSAEEYQWFTDLKYDEVNFDGESVGITSIKGVYFLDKKKALGPYNEFDYINKTSNVGAFYADYDDGHYYSARAEFFIDSLLIGTNYSEDSFNNSFTQFSLGYLFGENFLLRLDRTDYDGIDTEYRITAAYNHQLNKTDYLGFNLLMDDEGENVSLSTKYFVALQNNKYLSAEFEYIDDSFDNSWAAEVNYYFSKSSSAFTSFNQNDLYELGYRHFFNVNFAAYASYRKQEGEHFDSEGYRLGINLQF